MSGKIEKKRTERGGKPGKRRKVFLAAVLFVIAAATVFAVISHSRAFSPAAFAAFLRDASPAWLAAAALCVLGFVLFEGAAVVVICRAFGAFPSWRSGLVYSAADVYFSGITPSASGGQPMCAFFMIRDGIPASVTTAALLVNLTLYTLAILLIGILTVVWSPGIFLSFGLLSKVLILVGFALQILLTLLFLLLLTKNTFLHGVCRRTLRFLCRLGLLKKEEEKRRRLDEYMEEYRVCASLMRHRKKEMFAAFLLNFLQRIAILLVPMCVYMASGEDPSFAPRMFATQSYVVLGSNALPLPGAMGVSDYLMLDAYRGFLPQQSAVNLELLSRSLSFYGCVLLCGIVILIKYLIMNRRKNK